MSTPIPDKLPNKEEMPKVEASTRKMSSQEAAARARIEELLKLPPKEKQARLASVFDRGVLNDRFKVAIPDDLHGEWVRDDPLEIQRMETLGFWKDDQYATTRQLHSDGTSSAKIGDVVFMLTLKDNKKLIDQVMQERAKEIQRGGKQQEDKEFEDNVRRDTQGDIIPFSEGHTRVMDMNAIRDTLATANAQIGVT